MKQPSKSKTHAAQTAGRAVCSTTRRTLLKCGLYGLSVGLTGSWLGACSNRRPVARPNIVLILIDTLRPDYLGFYGFERETAPQLARLADRSVVFDRAFAPSSWTAPSTAAMLTSRYPHRLGVIEGFYCHRFRMEQFAQTGQATLPLNRIPATVPTLPETLRAAGYSTIGLSANINIGSEIGFDRGFDAFERLNDAPAAALRERLQSLLTPAAAAGPSFVYLHFNDPHTPYLEHGAYYHPQGDERADTRARYLSEIGYVDEVIGACLADIEARFGDTVVAVVSDHGEEFWDHGSDGHRPRLYRELTQVLMLLHAPHLAAKHRRVSANVSLLDVKPTLLELAGIETTPDSQGDEGESLLDLLRGGEPEAALTRRLSRRTLFGHRIADTPAQQLWSAIHQHWNLIRQPDGRTELYDHRYDLAEQRDVSGRYADAHRRLLAAIDEFRMTGAPVTEDAVQVELDAELIKQLESLGYVK